MSDILIVDDEADIRALIADILEDEGYKTREAMEADGALAAVASSQPSLIILDIWLQGSRMDGIEILKSVKRDNPDVPVVIISGHGNIEIAVAAIKQGAYDFIEKPFNTDQLLVVVGRALEANRLRRRLFHWNRRRLRYRRRLRSLRLHHLRHRRCRLAEAWGLLGHAACAGQARESVAASGHATRPRSR